MRPDTAGLILAGGASRRMGGIDKALLPLGSGTMIGRVALAFGPQVAELAVSRAGQGAPILPGVPVLPDSVPGRLGPLAGLLAGLDWAAGLDRVAWLATVPCDVPLLPSDLVARLHAARRSAGAVAASAGRSHPTVALWPLDAREAVRRALAADERRLSGLADAHAPERACWPAEPHDPFHNVNTPADLAAAEAILAAR